jgi:enoyl-[acyl-carrier protein] reductase II
LKTTVVCDLLGIKYPILQGGMLWLADGGLAAAVSNAGGLGVISPLAGCAPHGDAVRNLAIQIDRARGLTSRPLGVNLPLDLRDIELLVDLILEKDIGIVVTAAGNPALYTDLLKSCGVRILHVVSSVKQAVKARSAGVDGIIAEGVEAGARNGHDEIPLFSLIPQIADYVDIPVIAAGGIADARGMVAAMALGAKGVQLGTRFVAARECIAHEVYKKAILDAGDTDTVITLRSLIPSRSLKNTPFTKKLMDMEASGATPGELKQALGHAASRRAGLDGDLSTGEAYCGSSAGLIHEILSAADIIRLLVDGWDSIVSDL